MSISGFDRRGMVILCGVLAAGLLLFVTGQSAEAWSVFGCVYCDVNEDGQIDGGDTAFEGIGVSVTNLGSTFAGAAVTDENGCYWVGLPELVDSYVETLDEADLPGDATYVIPPSGVLEFWTGQWNPPSMFDWLIDSETCRDITGRCWLTGGGVKFNTVTGTLMAEVNGNGHGTAEHNIGGNVNPACSSLPGEGGQWNHINRPEKLHFQGWQIEVVRCGNVEGIEPGSESPVTPFNFIEFQGTGTLKGIHGNHLDLDPVYFWARAEDRNEPGNENANQGNGGAYIDRYFIHVFADPGDPLGTTLMLLDIDGDPATVDPVTITGGNLQMHFKPCPE